MKQDIRELLKKWQCEPCRKGKPCGCSRKGAKAYMEYPNGKRKWFCNIGCILLMLSDKEMKRFIEAQFNVDGHYEKLAR